MLEITILEGGRGTGKSTLAFKLRQSVPETTLINFTGFHQDGEDGLQKVSHYYRMWLRFFLSMRNHESKFIFDRFYFSEAIYSKLYKEYNFKFTYNVLNDMLEDLSKFGVKINIFFLTINDHNELAQRLIRDKVPFGKAEETVEQTLKQQQMYDILFNNLNVKYANDNLCIRTIDTSGKTSDEVYNEIMNIKTTN